MRQLRPIRMAHDREMPGRSRYSNDAAPRFSADELRAAAALLIEAADELDRLQ